MKKLFALLLVAGLGISVVGCGGCEPAKPMVKPDATPAAAPEAPVKPEDPAAAPPAPAATGDAPPATPAPAGEAPAKPE